MVSAAGDQWERSSYLSAHAVWKMTRSSGSYHRPCRLKRRRLLGSASSGHGRLGRSGFNHWRSPWWPTSRSSMVRKQTHGDSTRHRGTAAEGYVSRFERLQVCCVGDGGLYDECRSKAVCAGSTCWIHGIHLRKKMTRRSLWLGMTTAFSEGARAR